MFTVYWENMNDEREYSRSFTQRNKAESFYEKKRNAKRCESVTLCENEETLESSYIDKSN